MKTVVTIKVKIKTNKLLLETMKQYSKAIQYISDKGFSSGIHNRYKLHHLCYYDARGKFNLPSQFIVNANRIASQTLKSVKTNKGSKPVFKEYMPLAFDKRTFTFSFDKVRLTTINSRIDVPIEVPEYYWKYLDWNYQTALLIFDKNRMFLNITFSRDVKTNVSSCHNSKIVGVDVGINNLAVTSDGKVFKTPKTRIKQFHYLRRKLQAKGTKSAKRRLKSLSGRQKRFMTWVNHNVSKEVVNNADVIVMEDLKGIRKIRKGRRFNRWLNSWAFYQLQNFISYKSILKGSIVAFENPFMTSQTCCECLSTDTIRFGDYFLCLHCGNNTPPDLNASFNLRRLYVTQPNVSVNDTKGQLTTAVDIRNNLPESPTL